MISITDEIELDEVELKFDFVRSGGPGGQKVNKTSSAVVLRFNALDSPSLPEYVRERLLLIGGNRLGTDGVIVIHSRTHRSQRRNRDEAVDRLVELIRRAAETPVKRKPTRKSRASVKKRLDEKKRRGYLKRSRGFKPPPDETD